MLVIVLDVAGRVTSADAARRELLRGLASWLGRDGARTVASVLNGVQTQASGLGARAVETVAVVYGSTRLFTQTQRALNHLWDVTARPASTLRGRMFKLVRKRALAFAMVLLCGLALMFSVLLRATLVAATEVVGAHLPHHWHLWDRVVSFVVVTVLFAAVFKWLPDVKIAWRDAAAGALATSVLFELGKVLIARYLAHKATGSAFGVASSVVLLLFWVHYSAQIFFLGAAYTAVRARRAGRPLAPTEDAMRISVEET
jgi:membrane protein